MATKKSGKKKESMTSKMERFMGKNSKGTYVCQVCGKAAKNSVDAAAHLIDHVSSALESISSLIKDQEEGKVSNRDKGKGSTGK